MTIHRARPIILTLCTALVLIACGSATRAPSASASSVATSADPADVIARFKAIATADDLSYRFTTTGSNGGASHGTTPYGAGVQSSRQVCAVNGLSIGQGGIRTHILTAVGQV